ncbi:MAG: type IV pilus twitching motility protein PilT [Candidatus Omnitrophica bacterium]|nr:type IV pilus twitching motility protein PilT [Candidatus Omnitrophota bacterium]
MDIKELLRYAVNKGASDVHLTAKSSPILRIDGKLEATTLEVLTPEETKRIIYGLLNDRQKQQFEEELELDFSFTVPALSRFRVNVHQQRSSVEAAMRVVPSHIPTLAELGLPPIVAEFARKPNGLVLVTGPTGVGKTTTLAAIVDLINTEKQFLIVSIEDPIEYVHHNKRSVIKQREVFADTHSFASALKHVLRQDPNVVVVGEMRDLETIATALTAAETGHLVLATLHTPDAVQTVDRIIDVFPPHQQQQVRIQLAGTLQAVVSQQLLPTTKGRGRVVACEVMAATSAVRNLIRERESEQIPTLIQTGSSFGMQSMDRSLKDLYRRGIVSLEAVRDRVKDMEEFNSL